MKVAGYFCHVARMERREIIQIWLGISEGKRDHLEVGRIILKCIFKEWDGVGAWFGLIWLRRGTSGGILWKRWLTFGSRKIPGISWLAEELLRWVHTCNVTAYRNAVTLQVIDTIRRYDQNFHPMPHGVTVSCERYTMGFPVCYGSQKHNDCKDGETSGRWWRVTLHVQTCSGRNRIIPLMRRPNTDSAPNMPATLPRNQLLIRYVVTSPVHTVTIRCYGTR
jgi:hypothetical protein